MYDATVQPHHFHNHEQTTFQPEITGATCAGGRRSNAYDINSWLWQFGYWRPHLAAVCVCVCWKLQKGGGWQHWRRFGLQLQILGRRPKRWMNSLASVLLVGYTRLSLYIKKKPWCRIGSGLRYQILSHVFAHCASQKARTCQNCTRFAILAR